jgi:hypothetical protein
MHADNKRKDTTCLNVIVIFIIDGFLSIDIGEV